MLTGGDLTFFRTPMNGIIGMTDLTLESEGLTRSQKENLMLVHSLARSLLLIIDDILDISKSTLSRVEPLILLGLTAVPRLQSKPAE